MATYRLNNMNFSFSVRRAPKSGPTSSDKWNDTMDEISRDLTNIAQEWNQKLVPIIAGLPDGSDDSTVNAFVNGIDGANVWTDGNSDISTQGGRYFNTVRARPNTLKEQFEHVYTYFANELVTVQNNIISSSGLTDESKAAIGARIFDPIAVSSSISLDGVSASNTQNIVQLANDLYGNDAALNDDGNAILVNSLKQMVGALLLLHNGVWDTDVSLSHAGTVTVTQNDVGTTHPGNDSYGGIYGVATPTDLEGDLDRIRTEIKTLRGTATWQAAHNELYAGGANSLEDLLFTTQGSASKSASNPWGYSYSDIDGLLAILNATDTFTGKGGLTDSTPNYGIPSFVANGDSLETAITGLDSAIVIQSGITTSGTIHRANLAAFTGQTTATDSDPNYSSIEIVDQGSSLTTAIGDLDAELAAQSGLIILSSGGDTALRTFVGQDTPLQSGANYNSTVFIEDESPLAIAISALDGALSQVSGVAYNRNLEVDTVLAGGYLNDPYGTGINTVSIAASGHMVLVSGDYHVVNSGAGVIMYSPNGSRWRIQIDNTGSLLTTAI